MRPRDLFHWKTHVYGGMLPALRGLGPERADAALDALGRLSAAVNPARRALLRNALRRARVSLGTDWQDDALVPALSAGMLRFQARDYLLDTRDDAQALARFDVKGGELVDAAAQAGRGLIVVGAHYGAHLAAFHWLFRRHIPLRVMVQRPRHISRALGRFFEEGGPDPQSAFFLTRGLGPADCVERLLRVRAALRSGKAVYFAGDIPWTGPNTRAGHLLGQRHSFLSVWADLSALTGAPVVTAFCNHRPGGRFSLQFQPQGTVPRGGENAAVADSLTRLESAIAADPCDAVAHLLWPCYGPPCPAAAAANLPSRPGRRRAAVLAP